MSGPTYDGTIRKIRCQPHRSPKGIHEEETANMQWRHRRYIHKERVQIVNTTGTHTTHERYVIKPRQRPHEEHQAEAGDTQNIERRHATDNDRGKAKQSWPRNDHFCKPATYFQNARGQPKTPPFQLSECSLSSHPLHIAFELVTKMFAKRIASRL